MVTSAFWLLLLHSTFMLQTLVVNTCHDGCSCLPDIKYVNCSDRSVATALNNFPVNTEYLDMSRNLLTKLPSGSFRALWGLKVLLLRENNITSVADRAFIKLNSLRKLDLSQNQLSALGDGFSLGLDSLTELVLAHNYLRVLESTNFENLHNLVKLDVSANIIENIKPRALSSLTALRRLHFQRNRLTTLGLDFFSTLHSLEVLRLRGNQINMIEPGTFASLCNLVLLDLTFNQLSGLHFKTLLGICASNAHVLLEGNPWHCDCDLQRVFRKLASIHRLFLDDYEKLMCNEPTELKGSLMMEVADGLCVAETVTVLILTVTVLITVLAAVVMGEKNKRRGSAKDWTEETSLDDYCDN